MNLQRVNPGDPAVRLLCVTCGGWDRSDRMIADLDGEPFRAFYCEACGAQLVLDELRRVISLAEVKLSEVQQAQINAEGKP